MPLVQLQKECNSINSEAEKKSANVECWKQNAIQTNLNKQTSKITFKIKKGFKGG